MYKYLSSHVYIIRYTTVADESVALLLSLMPNCNKNKIAWHNWYNRNDVMLIYMKCFTHAALCILKGDASLRTPSTDASGCFFTNVTFTAVAEIGIRGAFCEKLSYINWVQLVFRSSYLILNWPAYFYSTYMSSMNIEFHLWYENCRRHFQMYLQWKCLNFDYNFTEVCSQGSNWL